jgi:hypothetical protein
VAAAPGFLHAPLLAALQRDAQTLLDDLTPRLPASELEPGPAGVGHVALGPRRAITRVDGLVEANALPSVLALLGSPGFVALARAFNDDPVITQVDLVVRTLGDAHVIAWHQDAVFERTHRHAALGLALDDTDTGDGDLLILPGTQGAPQDLCALEDAHGFAPPGLLRIAPRAGDLVLHDAMLVHGSLPLTVRPLRRTLYVYLDSAARILRSEPDSGPWLAWREGLWEAAGAAWQAFQVQDPAWRSASWSAALQGPARRKPMTLAGNYCIRHDGRIVGNSVQFFAG